MQAEDFLPFSEMLDAVWSLKGQPLSAVQKAMFFRVLAVYPLGEVRAGLDAHLRDPKRGAFLPMPADVIAQISGMAADDGRPGAEEAWATVVRAGDEAVTIVWTTETAEAFGIARPLILARDDIGARMAFKESYVRLVSTARERRVPVQWSATLGHDIAGRDAVLLPHVQAGRLSADLLALPAIGLDSVLTLPAPVGTTASNLEARAKAREALARLRAEVSAGKQAPSAAEAARERTEALKARAAVKVRAYGDITPNPS